LGKPKSAARNRWYESDLVALCQRGLRLSIGSVHRVEQASRFVAEAQRGPDVRDGGSIREVELPSVGLGELAEAGEQSHGDVHGRSVGRISRRD
jgi:hypothetical protein